MKKLFFNFCKKGLSTGKRAKIDPYAEYKVDHNIYAKRFEGKYAIVTGGSQGIGRATCELFGKSGISGIIIADINEENGKLVEEALNKQRGGKQFAYFIKSDMGISKSIQNMIKQAMGIFDGKLNIMFNNAGIMLAKDNLINEDYEELWDKTIDVNLKSIFLCCKYGIPHLLNSGGGSVINTASLLAVIGSASPQVAYAASKGGVLSMTREMSVIYGKQNIRFNCLCPGSIKTLCFTLSPRR
jgi:NAD(P)-dependent dehydrogenase (short-subunit alcohol dehydrogenase family)